VITILVDHNLEGQAERLAETLTADGWLEIAELRFMTLDAAGLFADSTDRTIWRFVQAQGMLLLTGNRNMKGEDSLEQTLREEGVPTSLPVITIGSVDRLGERIYRAECAARLVEIVLDLENYRGASRLFIP
jgi:hypothetical protein